MYYLFYSLKIDDLFFVKCSGAAFQNVGFGKKYLKKIYYLPITALDGQNTSSEMCPFAPLSVVFIFLGDKVENINSFLA